MCPGQQWACARLSEWSHWCPLTPLNLREKPPPTRLSTQGTEPSTVATLSKNTSFYQFPLLLQAWKWVKGTCWQSWISNRSARPAKAVRALCTYCVILRLCSPVESPCHTEWHFNIVNNKAEVLENKNPTEKNYYEPTCFRKTNTKGRL